MTGRRLRVLGPTVVEIEGERRPVRGLAGELACLLASRYPDVVASDVIASALWPNRVPSESRSGLRVAIHRLRQLLGDTGAIVNENDGYRLALDIDEIDQAIFERAVGDADATTTMLDDALRLWRGPAFDPFGDSELLNGAATRLDSMRLDMQERHIDSLLADGHTDLASMRASVLVGDEPYRERRWELLMLALYRSGRQHEALDVAVRARLRLREDLGIDPGPGIVDLERDILNQAASLVQDKEPAVTEPGDAINSGNTIGGLGDLLAGLRSLSTELPRASGAFVGRDPELERVAALLDSVACVTIVGPPGAGKTRLAQRACRSVGDRRVIWLDLVGLTIDTLVGDLAARLGLVEGSDVAAQLVAELSREPALLVFDNAEHIVAAVAELVDALLAACPDLSILTTSRHRLGGTAETIVELGPLAPAAAAQLLGVRAFGQDIALDDARRRELDEAVEKLDRFPLYIELLAPLIRERPLAEALDVVTTAQRQHGGDRHASLADAIEWSTHVLSPTALDVHHQLGVFVGPFEAGDAAAVLGAVGDITDQIVAEAFAELVRHSLLQIDQGGRVPMYRQLVSVGEHARNQLVATDRLDALAEAHAAHFHQVAVDLRADLMGPGEEFGAARLARVTPQIELARRRLVADGDVARVGDIAFALAPYIVISLDHAHYRWVLDVAHMPGVDDREDLADLLAWAATAAWAANQPDETFALVERARAAIGDGDLPLQAYVAYANAAVYHGSDEQRFQAFVDMWSAAERYGTTWERSSVAAMLSLGYAQLGEFDMAATSAERSLELAREVANPSTIAFATIAVGWAELDRDPTRATRSFLAAVRICRTVGSRWVEGLANAAIVTAALRRERYHDVCQLLPDVLAHWGRTQAMPQLARAAREGTIALFETGQRGLAARMVALVERVELLHPLLEDHQRRYDEIVEELTRSGETSSLDSGVDQIHVWAPMVAIFDALAEEDEQASVVQPKGQ